MRGKAELLALLALALAPTAAARESLGLFGAWGAFADGAGPRCYAIAVADKTTGPERQAAYASIGTWPRREVRGQIYFRTSEPVRAGSALTLTIASGRFTLSVSGQSAWARDARADAAIVAALRSAKTMRVSGRNASGRVFSDRYTLDGAASALDAATVGCARKR